MCLQQRWLEVWKEQVYMLANVITTKIQFADYAASSSVGGWR